MAKGGIGQSWDEKYRSGESKAYALLETEEVLNFRVTSEIRRLSSLLDGIRGKTALEAGCGSGKFSLCLASYGYSVTSMDFVFPPLKNIRSLSVKLKISQEKMKTVRGDIERMPFKDGAYDLVFNEGVVEHWLDDKERVEVIREMARVAREGGYVVIYVPNGRHPFYERWVRTGYPGYLNSPPMTLYDTGKLKREMESAGLKEVVADGVSSFHSLNLWPCRRWLRLPLGVLNRYFPLPKRVRCRWGANLIGIGRK